MKRIQICADDYAFDAGVSRAIIECIDTGRISATSCMVLAPGWPAAAAALRERIGIADIGLHLDVNEFADYSMGRSLQGWIAAAYLGQLDQAQANRWVAEQLDAFEAGMQRAPDYLDGHQHVHQLPVLRDAVLGEMSRRYGSACALRSTRSQHWRGAKAALIAGLGGAALRRAAGRQQLRMNADFAGVYDFDPGAVMAQLVAGWLRSLPDGGLLMAHPGADHAVDRPDGIRAARLQERAFWLSSEAGELIAEFAVEAGRCADWPAA